MEILFGFYFWIFNFVLVFIGSFVIINLVLAVVAINFLQSEQLVYLFLIRKLKKRKLNLIHGMFNIANNWEFYRKNIILTKSLFRK